MAERNKQQQSEERTLGADVLDAPPATNRSRLIASAIALLSSAALVAWAALHSQM